LKKVHVLRSARAQQRDYLCKAAAWQASSGRCIIVGHNVQREEGTTYVDSIAESFVSNIIIIITLVVINTSTLTLPLL
jgi:hypothetical protein